MEQTLLLNASYEPLKVVHWQKAVTLWWQGKVEIISVYDREVRAVTFSIKLPSVIRLLRYVRIKRRATRTPEQSRQPRNIPPTLERFGQHAKIRPLSHCLADKVV